MEDYVVRCNDGRVTVQGHPSGGWEAAIGQHPFRSGDFSEVVPLNSGRASRSRCGTQDARSSIATTCAACPTTSPHIPSSVLGPILPEYFSVFPGGSRYAIIFDRRGVPVWWYHGHALANRVLPGGNVLWWNLGRGRPTASTGASCAASMALASGPTPTTCS